MIESDKIRSLVSMPAGIITMRVISIPDRVDIGFYSLKSDKNIPVNQDFRAIVKGTGHKLNSMLLSYHSP